MRVSSHGALPSRHSLVRLARILAFGLVGVGITGCATQQPPQYAGVYQPVAERPWKVEIEEDGRPAQAPPVRRMRPEEDDPSQPWSPNYGGGLGAKSAPMPPQPSPRVGMPPLIDTSAIAEPAIRPSRTLSTVEADQVVLRAIQSHEVLRP